MDKFFKKYGHNLREKQALDMIHNKIDEARESEGRECYIALIDAYGMLEDLFEIKQINPNEYLNEEQDEYSEENTNQRQQNGPKGYYARGSRGVGGNR